MIGNAVGNWGVGMTTGFANVFIGPSATGSVGSGNNQVTIGYNIQNQNGNNTITLGTYNNWASISTGSGAAISGGTSDQRLKENIANSTIGLSFINDLTTRTFTWKKQKDLPTNFLAYRAEPHEDANKYLNGDSDATQLGFIAQEVKTVIDNHSEIPEGFTMWGETANDSTEQYIATGALIPILTKAIQELSAELDAAKARIATLEG